MAYGVPRLRTTWIAWARDFTLALAVFWLLVPAIMNLHAPAHATGLPPGSPAIGETPTIARVQARGGEVATLSYARIAHGPMAELNAAHAAAIPPYFLLSLVVALLTACNLAFLRHLRRAYAKPSNRKRSNYY